MALPRLLLMATLLAISAPMLQAAPIGRPLQLSDRWQNDQPYMGVLLRGIVELRGDPALAELSGLGWDADEQLLYGVTDRGLLLTMRPQFDQEQLTGVELLAQRRLLGSQGHPLPRRRSDAEGLVVERGDNGVRGDSRLLISFEGENRIDRYLPDGSYRETLPLPQKLRDSRLYRSANNGLEAVALHPRFGLISGPEFTAGGEPVPLASEQGAWWRYEPFELDGGLVGLEAMPDGSLLVLERAFTQPFSPWVITLSRIRPTLENSGQLLDAELLVRFDSVEGWRIHNIEGITRQRGQRLFLVSDDGGMRMLQTQLIYLEIR